MEQLTFIIHVAACLVSSSAALARVVDLTACTLLNLTHPRAESSFENPGAAELRVALPARPRDGVWFAAGRGRSVLCGIAEQFYQDAGSCLMA